jgi:Bacterial membrane protein YfhO
MINRVPRTLLILAGLAVVGLLFYRQASFSNLIFARGDTLLYFYPYWDYRAQTLLAGHLPLWNPYLFMGVPFLANSQAGVFYPLNWPLIFFAAPVAVKISIVAHVILAAGGMYALARRAFGLDAFPAALAALVFALGGYLTAQVEHVNQLQGLAWLPFALLFTHQLTQSNRSRWALALLALTLALQLTAGHTQTAFITLGACVLVAFYNLASSYKESRPTLTALSLVGVSIGLGFALATVQLAPTLELSRLSLRGGGLSLNQAVSFSLNPLLVGRALLPGYSRTIFSEFVGYVGIVPLALATFGLLGTYGKEWRTWFFKPPTLALLLAGLGLFFALGGYNPIYLVLARFVPGFNLFRVPARWLVLWALGAALLAGYGLQKLMGDSKATSNRELFAMCLPIGLLGVWSLASATVTPAGELGPMGWPTLLDLALWVGPLVGVVIVIRFPRQRAVGVSALAMVELFVAALGLPLNHLTTPDAYASIRPAMTQLLAAKAQSNPPDRFLSLSALEFDPGDLGELHSEWGGQLPPDAVYDAIIATKQKEVLSPNLPLTWGLAAVDGYDGGILPLRAYAEFAKQFGAVPDDMDGRLRQVLKTIPPNSLLSLTNTRWIITDKTGDAWVDNVFYDLGLTATATSPTPLTFNRLPKFEATALGLVLGEGSQDGVAQISLASGRTITAPIKYDLAQPALRLHWEGVDTVIQIVILTPTTLTLRGASLIDERTDSFQSLTLGPYRLAHSGDVKIYENLNVLPRAFMANDLASLSNSQAVMRDAKSIIKSYSAENVIVETESEAAGYLVLTDTNYPGWTATVDGQPTPIETADGLFRAVPVTAGAHTVEFRFEPVSLKVGAVISGVALIALLGLGWYAIQKSRMA